MTTKQFKPFDLEAALAGAPVQTKDGRKVRLLCFDRKTTNSYHIIGLLDTGELELVFSWTTNGVYESLLNDHGLNLVMSPVKKEGWIVLYPIEPWRESTIAKQTRGVYYDKKEAEKVRGNDLSLPVVKVEWEE